MSEPRPAPRPGVGSRPAPGTGSARLPRWSPDPRFRPERRRRSRRPARERRARDPSIAFRRDRLGAGAT
ncbi:MAG: hypothetical protein FJ108_09275 [Deltaproteobacteria bacterium]|nr:hypothetical protein [Deltaproteobacteria bacterium]